MLESGWCDLDQCVVAAVGRSITDLINVDGEAAFRRLESAAMERVIGEPPQVIATGGGWAAEPGNLTAVAGRALVIYLSLSPDVAARRLAGATDRPLLAGRSVAEEVAAQLARREPWYRLADIELAAGDAPPEAIAAGVVTAARQYGGW